MTRGAVTHSLFRLGLVLARCLPYRACAACGAVVGRLAGMFSPVRKVVNANLAIIESARPQAVRLQDPEPPLEQGDARPAVVRAASPSASSVLSAYGRYWGEFMALAARPARLDRLRVRVEGEEHLRTAVARGPVCVLTGHLGNWDLGACLMARRLPHFAVVAEELEPLALFRLFVRARERAGCAVIPAAGGGVRLFRHWRRGGHAGLVADRVFGTGSRAAPFFGGLREFPAAGMDLARRAGATLVPMFLVRDVAGYRLRIHPALSPAEDPVAAFARVLEAEAQAFAAQWCLLYPLHASAAGTQPARTLPVQGKAATA